MSQAVTWPVRCGLSGQKQAKELLPISRLPLAEQVARESAGIVKSLGYAKQVLGL